MSKQLVSVVEKLLEMPHFKNENARGGKTINGHEDAIASLFENGGFQHLKNKEYPKLNSRIMSGWEESKMAADYLADKSDTFYKRKVNKTFGNMPLGSFIRQPAGKQNFPDLLVRDFDGRFILFEGKSGSKPEKQEQKNTNSTGAPMWNNNLPKPGCVYIYSNERNNQTTVFLGEDVIDLEVILLQQQLQEQLNITVADFKQKISGADKKNRGWELKFRPQNFQGGGNKKCDYFKHKDRKQCENNVLEFVNDVI